MFLRGATLQETVVWEGADRLGDCVGVKGAPVHLLYKGSFFCATQ